MLGVKSLLVVLLLFQFALNSICQDVPLIPVQAGGKWGYCTPDKSFVIAPAYDNAFPFSAMQGADTYVAQNATTETDWWMQEVQFKAPLALVQKNEKYGLINLRGEAVTQPVSTAPFAFLQLSDELIGILQMPLIWSEDRYASYGFMAVMHVRGDLLTDFVYEVMPDDGSEYGRIEFPGWAMFYERNQYLDYSREDKILRVSRGNLFGSINEAGREVIPVEYTYLSNFSGGVAVAGVPNATIRETDYFWIDTLNNRLRPFEGVPIGDFEEGFLRVDNPGRGESLINRNGKVVIPPGEGTMYGFAKGIAIAGNEEKGFQVYDTSGAVLFHFKRYDDFWEYRENMFLRSAGGQWFVRRASEFIPCESSPDKLSQPISVGDKHFFPIVKDGKWGLWNEQGRVVLPYRFDGPISVLDEAVEEGAALLLWAAGINRKVGVLGADFETLIPFVYDGVYFREGRFYLKKANFWGVANAEGHVLAEPAFDALKAYYTPYFPEVAFEVEKAGKRGYLDAAGQVIIEPVFDFVDFEYLKYADAIRARIGRDETFVLKDGTIRRDLLCSYVYGDNNPCFPVLIRQKNYPDRKLRRDLSEVWPPNLRFVTLPDTCDVIIAQGENGWWGIVNLETNDTMVDFKYRDIYYRPEGAMFVMTRKDTLREVFFWKENRTAVLPHEPRRTNLLDCETIYWYADEGRYNTCSPVGSFFEDRADFCHNGRFGYLDKNLKVVIPAVYKVCLPFQQGLAGVKKDSTWGFIDRQGHTAIPFVYEDAYSFQNGRAAVSIKGLWGMIDVHGNAIVPFIYERVFFRAGHWILKAGEEKFVILDSTGAQVSKVLSFQFIGGMITYLDENWRYGEIPTPPDGRFVAAKMEKHNFESIVGGLWIGYLRGRAAVFDQEMYCIIPPEYDDIIYRKDMGLFQVTRRDLSGLFDVRGRCVLPVEYKIMQGISNGLVAVHKDGQKHYFAVELGRVY